MRPQSALIVTLTLLACSALPAATVVVDGSQTLVRGGGVGMDLGVAAWGPKWAWMGWRGEVTVRDGESHGSFRARSKRSPAPTTLERLVTVDGKRVVHRIAVSSEQAQDYTMVAPTIDPGRHWRGKVRARNAAGEWIEKNWPIGRDGLGEQIEQIVFVPASGEPVDITLSPAIDAASDGAIRLVLAKHLDAGERKELELVVTLNEQPEFVPSVEQLEPESSAEGWFAWQPAHDFAAESAFAMDDWIAEPAGSAGRIQRDGQDLRYAGRPFKGWGLNHCFASCAPDKDLAERRAAFYARNGINVVRLHKWADGSGWAGILQEGSNTEFDPEKLDRMDYFVAELKKRGIFVKLSSTFGSMTLAEEGQQRIPYSREWGQGKKVKTGGGAIFLSEELQDLHIEQLANLLHHENPYTGLRYADDPAVMLVELVNEESALFYGTLKQLQSVPTLKRRMGERFFAWLLERYGSREAIVERWGERGGVGTFGAERMRDEDLEAGILYPVGNPWFWDPANITGSQAHRAARLYDAALFLSELQNRTYDRMAEAVRASGYEGLLMASNWQAGSGSSHYYNLHSDARFDVVDRHNYFGGGATMIAKPGGGSLSSGLQQVEGRPFSLSEWIHVFPNQWGAEGPAIIGAYGMGLQDWDVSFLFQNRDQGGYSPELGQEKWDVTAPHLFATFPAIARQVRRGDVASSDETAYLNVHHPSLHEGELGVADATTQAYDVKSFETAQIPSAALAVQRVAVRFVDEPTTTEDFDLEAHRTGDGALRSTTGQLLWMPGDRAESGWFSIDSPGTKAVVGFAEGTRHELGGMVIEPRSRYDLIYVTAQSPQGTVADDARLLVVASGRAHNTGMKYLGGKLLAKGEGPVLMEPVTATITIDRPGTPSVHVCDHDGRRTGETIPVEDGRFTIDGRQTRTIYYELVFDE